MTGNKKTSKTISLPKQVKSQSGRTLLIKTKSDEISSLIDLDNLEGLVNKSELKQHKSFFLTFDTIPHAESAFTLISSDYNVKYSYYKIFFKLSTNVDSSNCDMTKQEIKNYIETNTTSSVLFCKLYNNKSSYMNCGDLIVDTIDAMKELISKDSTLKQFKTDKISGSFYRFNNTKYKTQDNSMNV